MNRRNLQIAALQHLYWLAASDRRVSVRLLAERLGLSLATTANLVSVLDDQGLANARSLTLTLSGLALAVAACSDARAAVA